MLEYLSQGSSASKGSEVRRTNLYKLLESSSQAYAIVDPFCCATLFLTECHTSSKLDWIGLCVQSCGKGSDAVKDLLFFCERSLFCRAL